MASPGCVDVPLASLDPLASHPFDRCVLVIPPFKRRAVDEWVYDLPGVRVVTSVEDFTIDSDSVHVYIRVYHPIHGWMHMPLAFADVNVNADDIYDDEFRKQTRGCVVHMCGCEDDHVYIAEHGDHFIVLGAEYSPLADA